MEGYQLFPTKPIPLFFLFSCDNLYGSSCQAFLVAKDFGALVAYDFALCHPNRTCGVMGLGIPFGNDASSINTLPEGLYIFRWAVIVRLS
jgi:hypothetical protein